MAKIPRIFQSIFGQNAPIADVGVFGSFAAGAPANSFNVATIQSLSAWVNGWRSAILGNNSPAIEDMNGAFFALTSQLAYLFQAGVPEWEATTPYYTGSFVQINGVLYRSLTDANTGNAPATNVGTFWQLYDPAPSGIIYPFAGISTPINYALCDGGAESRTAALSLSLFNTLTIRVTGQNGTGSQILSGLTTTAGMLVGWPISGPNIPAGSVITSIDSGSQIHISQNTTGINAAGTAFVVAPWGVGDGVNTFNRPDLRGRSIMGAGTGTGLSARTLAQLLGAETHTLTNAEMPSHNHGGATGTDSPDHSHNFPFKGGSNNQGGSDWSALDNSNNITSTTYGRNSLHTHSIGYDGGSAAHSILNPHGVANYIIKY